MKKKMIQKLLTLTLSAAMVLGALTGCGGDADSQSGQPEERLADLMAFGSREIISIGQPEEFAIVSKVMSEADYQETALGLEGILSVIRMLA